MAIVALLLRATGDFIRRRGRPAPRKEMLMSVILVFICLVLVGDTLAVAISAAVEHFSQSASLMVFFALFAGGFWLSWVVAVRITERFLVRSN
jgi:hypothetical protein